MKRWLAFLLAAALLLGAVAFAEETAESMPAEESVETTPAADVAENAPAEETIVALETGWVVTAAEVLEITQPLDWMKDEGNIAYAAIMLFMDAISTDGFTVDAEKYHPLNAYVGVTTEEKLLVMFPSHTDFSVLWLEYDAKNQQSEGHIVAMEFAPDDAIMTASMTQLCGVNVNKTDSETVSAILLQFAQLSGN